MKTLEEGGSEMKIFLTGVHIDCIEIENAQEQPADINKIANALERELNKASSQMNSATHDKPSDKKE